MKNRVRKRRQRKRERKTAYGYLMAIGHDEYCAASTSVLCLYEEEKTFKVACRRKIWLVIKSHSLVGGKDQHILVRRK